MNTRRKKGISKPLLIGIIIGSVVILAAIITVIALLNRKPDRHPIDIATVRNILPAAGSINTSGGYYTYDDPSAHVTSKTAIDVSAHQFDVDWENVKANHIDAAYIRLGLRGYESGAIVMDEYFEQNIQNAYDADISVGVYFFSQALNEAEAIEEAEYVIGVLQEHPIDLHVVYDFERIEAETSRSKTGTEVNVNANAIAFCEKIKEAGYTPMIYTNAYTATTDYDLSQIGSYPIWYANYNEIPTAITGCSIWQYTEEGSLADGSMYPVDLDLIFVDSGEED